MRFLPDERLYWDAGHCLRFLRELETPDHGGVAGERFHAYWQGPFTAKQAFSVKSILATQTDAEVWLWLDADDGYAAHESNPLLRSLPPRSRYGPSTPQSNPRGRRSRGDPSCTATSIQSSGPTSSGWSRSITTEASISIWT